MGKVKIRDFPRSRSTPTAKATLPSSRRESGLQFALTEAVVSDPHRHPTTSAVIDAAIRVHRLLGPGLLESVYQGCLAYELAKRRIPFQREYAIPVIYDDVRLECGFRADLLVDGDLIVEVKSMEKLLPIHTAQALTYLRLTGARQVLLLNFGQLTLMAGLKSFLGNGNDVPCGAQ
jgi:GxxExxY protein